MPVTCPPNQIPVQLPGGSTVVCIDKSTKPPTQPPTQPGTRNCQPGYIWEFFAGGTTGACIINSTNPIGTSQAHGSNAQVQSPTSTSQASAVCGACSIIDLGACACIFGTVIHDTLVSWAEHIAIFVIALIVIILGFYLLNEQGVKSIARKAL